MSSTPARCLGWLPTIPTGYPSSRASPTTMFGAKCSWTSRNSASSTISEITSRMSYGFEGSSGTIESSAASARSGSS